MLQCPKCQSFKTLTNKQEVTGTGIALVVLGFLFSFFVLPLLLVPVGIITILAGRGKATTARCRNCGYKWSLVA